MSLEVSNTILEQLGGIKVKSEHSDIYAESLRDLFTRVTGLETSLGTMRARA